MPRLQISHRTVYRYRKPVAFGEHRVMMRPRESYDQHVISAELSVSPDASVRRVHDVFGNCVSIASFDGKAAELVFDSRVLLDHRPHPLASDCDEAVSPATLNGAFAYDDTDLPDLLRSVERGFADPDGAVERWVRRFLKWNGPTLVLPLLTEMTRAIHADFTYRTRLHGGVQSPAETLALGSGACRDFAVLMMEGARALGLAAHFVSGYLYVPPVTGRDGVRRVGGGHTHAWVEVYLPSCGWVEFDPTNGLIGNSDLVRVAVVRDPRQATPLWGSWSGKADDYLGMEVVVDLSMEPERDLSVA
ncbi:transglutaminase family protein [Caulobacter sp. KR2-114]|uniref:transglutaminase family protein n=1 Tax=Caulobacter sp. KR2-114 TaxID=3400912 RepID=UPI003C01EE9A